MSSSDVLCSTIWHINCIERFEKLRRTLVLPLFVIAAAAAAATATVAHITTRCIQNVNESLRF